MRKSVLLIAAITLSLTISGQPVSFSYISPAPGSVYINPEQVLILKTGVPFDQQALKKFSVEISGSGSGKLQSSLQLSDDHKTLLIKPERSFILGEKVDVVIPGGLKTAGGMNIGGASFSFTVKPHHVIHRHEHPGCCAGMEGQKPDVPARHQYSKSNRDNSLPADYPAPAFVYTGGGVAPGYIFFTPNTRLTPQYNEYISIWDHYGTPVFYEKIDKNITDFKVLDDGILTYAINGLQNPELDCYYLMDSNYDIFDSVRAGNGYNIDNHDILLLINGHYLILIYDQQVVNMSLIVPGGDPAALVTGLVIQEVDLNRNVYFQWRSWDHYEITDATWDISLTSHWIDYVHGNALELDFDGNILVSCRNMDEITKISYTTGDIIWRLGINAKNNEFDFNNDPVGFSHQHDIRKLNNGNYTVYDNGNLHVPPHSRALEYHLNEVTKEAVLVWNYMHDPIVYAPVTGSNQRLPNNNRLIGWGGTSPLAITEVTPGNQVVFELYLPDSVSGYRAVKHPWETTVFSTEPDIDFGNYTGYTSPKRYILRVINNYSHSIQITSAHQHHPDIFTTGNLPVTIAALGYAEIPVDFHPYLGGVFEDLLTLNYDNFTNTKRISRQLILKGLWDPDLPSLQFDPVNMSTDVDPAAEITVTFSEPVRKIFGQELKDPDVPNLFIFNKSDRYGNPVAFHGTVSDDKTIITIIPDQPLDQQQRYFIRQRPNRLEDMNGNVLTYSDFCFFTTGYHVGVTDQDNSSKVRIYPNPSSDRILVESAKEIITKAEIYTEAGRLLYSGTFHDHTISLNVIDYPAGWLNVRITLSNGDVHWKKVILQ